MSKEQELNTTKPDRYKEESFRAFNVKWPEHYDHCGLLRIFGIEDWDHAVITRLKPVVSTNPILDIGCATGRLLSKLAEQGAMHLCGVDIAPRMLEKADKKLKRTGVPYELKVADVEERLPWPDSYFGAAVVSAAIHHFYRPLEALEEIHRVISPGGALCVVEPRFPWGIRHLVNTYMTLFSHDGDYRFYSPMALSSLLASSNFIPERNPTLPNIGSYMIVAEKPQRSG